MSWIIGSLSKKSNAISYDHILSEIALLKYDTPTLYLRAGGNKNTFRCGSFVSSSPLASFDSAPFPAQICYHYVILGDPIICQGDSYIYPEDSEWQQLFGDEENIRNLDGHYLILITDGERLIAYNDHLARRSLYIHEDDEEWFFTSSLSLLKLAKNPQIDFERLGAYWHTMFPANVGTFAPSFDSYYKNVSAMGSGAKVRLGKTAAALVPNCEMQTRLFNPATQRRDILSLIQSSALLPAQRGKRIAISMSGGMDIRALLAIYLGAGVEISAYFYGDEDTLDFQISQKIAKELEFPLHRIPHEDTYHPDHWQQCMDFKQKADISANPVNARFTEFCRIVSADADVLVSGYFGEFFRIRYYTAPLRSIFRLAKPDSKSMKQFLYHEPGDIFNPLLQSGMREHFRVSLAMALAQMPHHPAMLNPLWFHLFMCRYLCFSKILPRLAELDGIILDLMPWMQHNIVAQHWQQGFAYQLGEGIHRELIKRNCPRLEAFPLVTGNTQVPYQYRQYALKIKAWWQNRGQNISLNINDAFLQQHKNPLLERLNSTSVNSYEAYNLPALRRAASEYYRGDASQRAALMSWLAFDSGK